MHTLIFNHKAVIDWFGHWPNFHDAEVQRFCLYYGKDNGHDSAQIAIHAFEMTRQIVNGRYVLAKHAVVTFELDYIGISQLEGWNHQNALFALRFEKEGDDIVMLGEGSFGVEFKISARDITIISVAPCDSNGNVAEQGAQPDAFGAD